MASVDQTRATKCPISVVTRTRSPVPRPMVVASALFIHSGCLFAISLRNFALPERVWISVGRRKFGMSTNSLLLRSM
jgi:hypothetical protein